MPQLWAEVVEWNWLSGLAGLVGLPVLVALNAFFVAAEFALVAVRKTRVEELQARGIAGAKWVLAAVEHLDRTIAATQLGVTVSSLGLGWLTEASLAAAFISLFQGLAPPWNLIATHTVSAALAFIVITYLHVVFGEFVPKSFALQAPDRIALWVAQPLHWFTRLTRPLIIVIQGTGNFIVRLCGFKPTPEGMIHSVEELALLIEDTEEAGILDPDQAELVQNVFELSKKDVRDCMVPREEMAALELNMPPEKILEAVRSGAHTRMPVYDTTLDNILGFVNTKDLFYLFSLKGVVVLEDAIYPALYLKPDEEIANALRLFKKTRRPMALVRDGDNKILGLITFEDVLEQIIGDIEDEHDRPTPKVPRAQIMSKLRRRPARR